MRLINEPFGYLSENCLLSFSSSSCAPQAASSAAPQAASSAASRAATRAASSAASRAATRAASQSLMVFSCLYSIDASTQNAFSTSDTCFSITSFDISFAGLNQFIFLIRSM